MIDLVKVYLMVDVDTELGLKDYYNENCFQLVEGRGLFVTDWEEVQPNDLILFDLNRDGWGDRVGLVVKIDGELVTSIERNINGEVNCRVVSIKSKSIVGVIKVGR